MIRYANPSDFELLRKYEHGISDEELESSLSNLRILLIFDNNAFAGWLRYNLFWDNTPFMNMLYILDNFQGCGLGTALIKRWEDEMSAKGFKLVLTSTLSNEQAQFFYRKNGYIDCGSLLLPNEALEIIFRKDI